MRPGQPADLFHMFPGERGKAAPNPQNKTLKKKKTQKDKDSWQVLGFRNPAEKARAQRRLGCILTFISFVRGRLITGTSHFHRTEMFYIVTSYEVTQL